MTMLKRLAFWPNMVDDANEWLNQCQVCHRYRTATVPAPMRGIMDESTVGRLPWSDVIIDCQGPFVKSERGNCYILSYHCLRQVCSRWNEVPDSTI